MTPKLAPLLGAPNCLSLVPAHSSCENSVFVSGTAQSNTVCIVMALSHLMAGMGTRPHLSKPAGDHQSVSYRPHSNSTNQNPKQRRIDLYLLLLFQYFYLLP